MNERNLHFVPVYFAGEVCNECDQPILINALMMVDYAEIPKRLSCTGVSKHRVTYCEPCGKLLLESQER